MEKNVFCVDVLIINCLDVQGIFLKNVVVLRIRIYVKIIIFVLDLISHENLNNICILFQYIQIHYDDHKFHIHS
jgi:hypothetical protein